jgi:putative transposase
LKFDLKIHHRKSIRLKGYDYSQAGGYFITIVTDGRENLFGEVVGGEIQVNALGRIVQECWDEIPAHVPNVDVDAFVVMPNHIHGIIFIHENDQASVTVRRGTIYRAPTTILHRAPTLAHHLSTSAREQFGKPTVASLSTIIRTFKASVTRQAPKVRGRAGRNLRPRWEMQKWSGKWRGGIMAEDHDLLLEEWLGVLVELWTALGKPLEADRLEVYRNSLGEVPLGLLELAVRRVIRKNKYYVVPLPGAVWEEVWRELGNPWDIRMAMEDWVESRHRLFRRHGSSK